MSARQALNDESITGIAEGATLIRVSIIMALDATLSHS